MLREEKEAKQHQIQIARIQRKKCVAFDGQETLIQKQWFGIKSEALCWHSSSLEAARSRTESEFKAVCYPSAQWAVCKSGPLRIHFISLMISRSDLTA